MSIASIFTLSTAQTAMELGCIYALVALGPPLFYFYLSMESRDHDEPYLTIYEQVMNYCDAVGLGIFTVLGVYTAHGEGYDGIFFLVFLGMMTGIGGGLIRDILADTMPFILYKHIYAMAAFAGALVCVLLIISICIWRWQQELRW